MKAIEHKLAVMVWNDFIAKTSNQGVDFSFSILENKIKKILNAYLEDLEGNNKQTTKN